MLDEALVRDDVSCGVVDVSVWTKAEGEGKDNSVSLNLLTIEHDLIATGGGGGAMQRKLQTRTACGTLDQSPSNISLAQD